MSSRAESKTASQFASLTLKLKGKIQSQTIRRFERIKHSPSQKTKPPDLNLEHENTIEHKSVCGLADQERAVISSLQYFKALVDRLGVDKLVQDQSVVGGLLGGASGGVLEAVQTLVQLEPRLHSSKTISSCLTRLYQYVAQLIRWTDQVMLQGAAQDSKDSKASVTAAIRAVLDGVKELVRLASERQDSSAPLSPVQLQPPVEQTDCFKDQPSSDRLSASWSQGTPAKEEKEEEEQKKLKSTAEQIFSVPPKPPMPLIDPLPQMTPQLGLSPPALPPKKRHSLPGPTLCRVAIVAPMRRESDVNIQLKQEDEEFSKRCSSSSANSSTEKIHCEEDPDYNFLHTDLSSSESLPPLPPQPSLPPALPEKRNRSATAGNTVSQVSTSFGFDAPPQEQSPAYPDDVIILDQALSPLSPSKTPPPLPEKKRHIHQYLQFCSSYSGQSPAMFYNQPSTFQRYSIRQREVENTYQLTHLDIHLETQTEDPASSPEKPPAPVLPPKKKQQDPVETLNNQHEDLQPKDSPQSLQQEEDRCKKSSGQLEGKEEVLLTNRQEILQRITMKPEDEEGPDVKGASPEILLVFATETDRSNDQGMYREAFLSTYRSFISPSEVISKLQHRYRHFCKGREPADLMAAKKTFHLLIRVVDELCAIELESDLLLLLMDLVFMLLTGGELGPAHLLRSNILSKMEQRWQLIGSPESLRPLAAKGVAARPGTLLDFRSQDLAEQLTLLDSELFYKIELPEVLLWSKEQNEERSPNLTQFTQHFNNMSYWVRSVIILQDKPHDREKLLLKFLKVMKHLRKLNNFNSYLSILSALDSAPLRRLDWQRSTAEALEEFSSLIDSSSSFRAYRAALAEVEPPCIPYLGLILQDLTFVHLGNPDTLTSSQESKVNFSKRWQQFNILDTLRTYQQIHYSLQPDDDIISFFNDFSDHLAEEALWELSLRLRPRNTPRANQR